LKINLGGKEKLYSDKFKKSFYRNLIILTKDGT
jgi:hypothetical protein